ncbi:phage tail fiber protein, partial [Acinetobacter baumannii]|nr:phage tail fiber protein [Acinetobacter baumannii]
MDSYSYDPLTNSVVFNVAPIEGTEITIERVTTLERSISYETYNNSFRPETLNYDLDRIWHVLQEQNVIDAEILARIKDEIEWRRTHDKEFDLLAQAREGNLFNALKSYMDTIGA